MIKKIQIPKLSSLKKRATTIFSSITKTGTKETIHPTMNERIMLSNKTALIISIASCSYFFIFYKAGVTLLAWLVIPIIISFLSCIVLNHLQQYKLSNFLLILFPCIYIIIYSYELGKASGIHLICFAISAYALIITNPHQKRLMTTNTLIPMATILLLEFTNYDTHSTTIPLLFQKITYISITLTTFSIIIIIIRFYIRTTEHSKNIIKKAYIDLKSSKFMLEKASEQTSFATLTRGIAHEIRNPMSMILSGFELMQDNLDNRKKIKKYALLTKDAILRLNNITTTMLKYGGPVSQHRRSNNINTIIDDLILISKTECKKRHISIKKTLKELPMIQIDADSIHHALLNITLNGIQAIGENGTLSFVTKKTTFLNKHQKKEEGIVIHIKDSGKGIPNEKLNLIFDPFFSTKYQNAGLGLSITLKIIDSHHGKINVYSKPNKFTCFSIHLPINNMSTIPHGEDLSRSPVTESISNHQSTDQHLSQVTKTV